jgi:aryl-alcohol dehydrogenase-like predicted oxidoreductase
VICQAYYNLVNRVNEFDLLPACTYFDIGVAAYSPLARGVLTGKYRSGAPIPETSRAARNDPRILQAEFRPDSMAAAERLQDYAKGRGMSSIDFALLWLLANQAVTSVVAGPRTVAQWQAYLDCLQHRFTPDDEAFADTICPPGHTTTPGFVDPKFPPLGRAFLRQ